METSFRNRRDAGRILASYMAPYADRPDVVILALPRGGVPVGFELAQALRAPLDVMVVRKLGVPGHEELAMGAIASGGVRILNEDVIRMLNITPEVIDRVAQQEQHELVRRELAYRGDRGPAAVRGRTVVLVDDGLATGSTMRAAVAALRTLQPSRIVIAVPTAAVETCHELKREADDVICAMTPAPFFGVGQWYDDFSQTTDQEVHDLLQARKESHDG
jgi:putative phosphoribosyl transferase